MSNINVPGTAAGTNATQLQGRNVKNAAPSDGQVLKWVNANSDWEPVNEIAPTFVGALLHLTSDKVVGASGTVSWDAADYDTSSFFSGGSPTRLTVPAGVAKVILYGSCDFGSLASGVVIIGINKNGSTVFSGRPVVEATQPSIVGFTSPPLAVVSTDYFELVFANGVGGTLVHDGSTYFSIHAVG